MINKTGRNYPCPCGSGKKYKKCCLAILPSPNTSKVIDLAWHKLRQLEGTLLDQHLIPYAMEELPEDVMSYAALDCLPDELPEMLDKELLFNNFFLPWYIFNWIPDDDFCIHSFEPKSTLAKNYLNLHERELKSQERRFIEAMNETYYSFYCVLEIEKEQSLLVKDILLGTTHTVKERQGTYQIKRGDLLFSRILTLDDLSIFVGMAPFSIPVDFYNSILDFKQWLIEENGGYAINAYDLNDMFGVDLVDYFFELMEMAYNRPFPILQNTDGELFQFTTSNFKLTITPMEALNLLLPMTLSKDPEKILPDASDTSPTENKRIEIPWLTKGNKRHKNWETTIMGYISIEKDKLTLVTNSEKRDQKGKKLLRKYLGKAITFQQTLKESPEQKMQSLPESDNKKEEVNTKLMALPEVQEKLQPMVKAHWENWFDDPIPFLENKTPREAAKTPEGRERLEALLMQYERHDMDKGDHPFKADINYLKSELVLD